MDIFNYLLVRLVRHADLKSFHAAPQRRLQGAKEMFRKELLPVLEFEAFPEFESREDDPSDAITRFVAGLDQYDLRLVIRHFRFIVSTICGNDE